jgi:ubiquinone/menaquinone biosynthesis C-methylase UbiE
MGGFFRNQLSDEKNYVSRNYSSEIQFVKMLKFDHFEWLSPYYDRFIKTDKPDRIIQLADLPTLGVILDAGGGTGRVSQQLLGLASWIVIIDFSLGMLKQASKKNGLRTVCAQTEKLPFPSRSFERVIMVDALHHVFSHLETLDELWRVVKPGGKILIEEPDVRSIMVKIVAVAEKLLLMRSQFINPVRIADFFQFPEAIVTVEREGHKSWVVIEKTSNGF